MFPVSVQFYCFGFAFCGFDLPFFVIRTFFLRVQNLRERIIKSTLRSAKKFSLPYELNNSLKADKLDFVQIVKF